jgi:hypothetical protein
MHCTCADQANRQYKHILDCTVQRSEAVAINSKLCFDGDVPIYARTSVIRHKKHLVICGVYLVSYNEPFLEMCYVGVPLTHLDK